MINLYQKEIFMQKILSVLFIILLPIAVVASPIDKANKYMDYGLSSDAKKIFIDIVFDEGSSDDHKAESHYRLGAIAFSENKLEIALEEWVLLQSDYPDQGEKLNISKKIDLISQVYGRTAENVLENAVARSYIKNGDFYSDEKSEITTIDTSWIPNIEAAVQWYDRVIEEFPQTDEAKSAYLKKFATVLGWQGRGQYSSDYGTYADYKKYAPMLEGVLSAFETEFPDDGNLQRLRFSIAQVHWSNRRFKETREWLNLVIEKDKGKGGFYADLSKWRLQKVEY